MSLFRAGLLDGVRVTVAGHQGGPLPESLRALGASVEAIGEGRKGGGAGAPHALVVDHATALPGDASDGLRELLDALWVPIEQIAAGAMIPSGEPGKVVLIAPPPGVGIHAVAAAAGIVNLARTLSVEWARHRITVTALTPADHTSAAQLADLVAYLLSPGGDYFSGCRFELGAIPADQFSDGSSGIRARSP